MMRCPDPVMKPRGARAGVTRTTHGRRPTRTTLTGRRTTRMPNMSNPITPTEVIGWYLLGTAHGMIWMYLIQGAVK